jgi:plastocyanin
MSASAPRRRRALRVATTALLALAALAGTPAAGHAATATISVGAGGDDRMSPALTTVTQGDTVVFDWKDKDHDLVLAGPEGTRVGEQEQGFKLTRTITRAGDYTFLCTLHDNMDGRLTVTANPSAPAPTAPPPVDVVVGPNGNRRLDPANVTVVRGQAVNWQWGRGGPSLAFADGALSGAKLIGGFWSRTFTSTGSFPYTSSDGASGTVTVVEPGAASGSGIRPAPAGATPAASVNVGGSGNTFAPANVTIDEGAAVRWTWTGGAHNVHFADGTDTGYKSTGTDTLSFYKPGTYSYLCQAHSGMTGTVNVTDTGAPGPNEEPPAPAPAPDPAPTPTPDPGPGTAPVLDIAVVGNYDAYSATDVTVQTGDWIRWTWSGGVHNVSFADGLDSGVRSSGTWSRRFLNPGEYTYVCVLHPGMSGRVVAVGAPVIGDPTETAGGGTPATDPAADPQADAGGRGSAPARGPGPGPGEPHRRLRAPAAVAQAQRAPAAHHGLRGLPAAHHDAGGGPLPRPRRPALLPGLRQAGDEQRAPAADEPHGAPLPREDRGRRRRGQPGAGAADDPEGALRRCAERGGRGVRPPPGGHLDWCTCRAVSSIGRARGF